MVYAAADNRYDVMPYRRVADSGLILPALSFGLWRNLGDQKPLANSREVMLKAFDNGIFSFDNASNYGPSDGSAEETFGAVFEKDLKPYRNELVITTKAGYHMWPGPLGEFSGKKTLTAALDMSLQRMHLDYVDIFYAHRWDPNTNLRETAEALDLIVRQGKALYVGVSNYTTEQVAEGLLTDRYLDGFPADMPLHRTNAFIKEDPEGTVAKLNALNAVAADRGQTLAQLAMAWLLRDKRVPSIVIGASSVDHLLDNVKVADNMTLSAEELAKIDAILNNK